MRKRKRFKKGVILLSGGLDSVTTLYLAQARGYKLRALVFNYGQRHRKEVYRARKIASLNKVACRVVNINLSWSRSALTNISKPLPRRRSLRSKVVPSTYVAGRNIIFLSYAFSLAETVGADKIFIGAHVQDYSGYPDCRPEFLKAFSLAANLGLKRGGIAIEAPLIKKSKKEIIRMGMRLGVPFELTWSCYQGGGRPCLECDSCRFRMNAFSELGKQDPLLTR